jgi:DNA-binding transcriptional regulator YdaS (Cro superfamily)
LTKVATCATTIVMSTLYQSITGLGMLPADLAKALRVHRSQVTRWNRSGVPPKHVRRVAEITGIPPHELRPDIFPAPSREAGK